MVIGGGVLVKKVLLRGPILSKSGYGEHARQIFKYLLSKDNISLTVQNTPWGMTPWNVNSKDPLIYEIMSKTVENPAHQDVSIQVQLPNEWDTSIADKNIGVTAGVETDFSNPSWASVHCQKMDLVITPSKHTKDSLLKSSRTETDIKVVPESYFDELLEEPEELDLNLQTSFNFLTVGVLTGQNPFTDRKNLFFLIKWFIEEFKDDSDVGLVIKTCMGRDTALDKHHTKNLLKRVLSEIGHTGAPKIYLLHGSMNRREMNSLYKHEKIKAFVSTTRGEGFGLPHLESAVASLPVIATNWSAHKEFLDLGKWIKIDYSLSDVHESKVDNNIFLKGQKWAEVSEKDFKKKLRTFYSKPQMPKDWANKLSEKLIENYSFRSISSKYDEALGEYLL